MRPYTIAHDNFFPGFYFLWRNDRRAQIIYEMCFGQRNIGNFRYIRMEIICDGIMVDMMDGL